MIADNYILENDNADTYENQISEKKIMEINDGNSNSYSTNKIKYQLSQLFNLNSLMNFKEGLLTIPLVLDFSLNVPTFTATITPDDVSKLVGIKSGSLITGIRIRVNGKSVVSYDSNLNEIIEFNFLSSCLNGNEKDWKQTLHTKLDEVFVGYRSSYMTYQKFYNDDALLSTKKESEIYVENNTNLIERNGYYEQLNNVGNLQMERQNYISDITLTESKKSSCKIYYWIAIKLGVIHDIFNKMGISRAFVDFELDINLGRSTVSCTTASTHYRLNNSVVLQSHTFANSTSSIYFNLDGVKPSAINKPWWKTGANPPVATEVITFDATLSIDNTIGTKLYIPVYKLKPSFNELYIKNSLRTIKYSDYLYYNLNNVSAGSAINFTISTNLLNAKYLLMVPQILNNKLNALNQSVLLNGPIVLSNLQLTKGNAIFNSPLVYSYDMFINYISNNNNINGGLDFMKNIFTLDDFNKIYRLYFFDLTLINNEKDVAYNLSASFVNKCNFAINVDFYVFNENELVFNRLNGTIGEV